MMNRNTLPLLFLVPLCSFAACSRTCGGEQESDGFKDAWKKSGGVEFRCHLKSMSEGQTKEGMKLLGERLTAKQVEWHIAKKDQNLLIVRVAGQDVRIRPLLYMRHFGRFEEREVASKKIHERWKSTGYDPNKVPAGWKSMKNDRKMGHAYDYLSHDFILVSEEVIITDLDIKYAGTSRPLSGKGWQIDFELTEGGAKKFDSMAKRLYNQDPNGLSAIILDGEIISKPTIQAEKYNGKGNISGDFSKEEAKELALALGGTRMPVDIVPFEERGLDSEGKEQWKKSYEVGEKSVRLSRFLLRLVDALQPSSKTFGSQWIDRKDVPRDIRFDVGEREDVDAGGGLSITVSKKGFNYSKVVRLIKQCAKDLRLSKNPIDELNLRVDRMDNGSSGSVRLRIVFAAPDWERLTR